MISLSNDLKKAGFNAPRHAPRNAPRTASTSARRSAPTSRPRLAGHTNRILHEPTLWMEIAPIALERYFQTYINSIGPSNVRTKYLNKLGISKFEQSKRNLLRAMENHQNNFTSVIMRLNVNRNNPNRLKQAAELRRQEKQALKNPNLLPLARAIKQASSAMTADVWNNHIPAKINYSNRQVKLLKEKKLLSLSNNKIDSIVRQIRLKIPRNHPPKLPPNPKFPPTRYK